MYERLLDKNNPPATDFIKEFIGTKSYNVLLPFEDFLGNNRDVIFPVAYRDNREVLCNNRRCGMLQIVLHIIGAEKPAAEAKINGFQGGGKTVSVMKRPYELELVSGVAGFVVAYRLEKI